MPSAEVWLVATRRSTLARTQARLVADALTAATGREAELLPQATTGDDDPERAVQSFDAKGLFVDGVRQAVLDGRADCAVHSFKDLPTESVDGLRVAGVPEREDPRDLLVTREGDRLATLPRGATIGTSSARRRAQIQRARRDVIVQPLRGNLDTRLGRVADGHLDAVAIAYAGMARLGPVEHELKAVTLEHGECLHAPAQGALAVECRADDELTADALGAIQDETTATCVRAERALLAALEGGCTAPIGAHAALVDSDRDGGSAGRLELLGMVADPSGTNLYRASHQAAVSEPETLGATLGETLREMGGDQVLQRLRASERTLQMGGP